MAVDVAEFEFTCNTTTGNQTIASGLGFTPKGYIIWSVLNTANATFAQDFRMFMGFSDGTTTRSLCMVSDVGTDSDTGTLVSNDFRINSLSNPTTTTDAIASHSSFGSGTITINWSDAPGAAYKMYGIAFGGADVSCEVKGFTTGTTTTGNQSYTTTMSNPKFGLFLIPDTTATLPNLAAHGVFSIGAALSTTKRALSSVVSENGLPDSDTWRLLDDTVCVGTLARADGTISWKADFVSWDANGFTLNYTDAPPSVNEHFFGFFLKGANFDLGVLSKRTSTGDSVVNPSSVGTLKGIMMFSNNTTKATTVGSHARLSIGAASGTATEGGVWAGNGDASSINDGDQRSEDANILIIATETASTIEAIANISAMGENTFTLSYTTCTTLAADIIWWVIGEPTSQLFTRTITESSISVSETNARILSAFRTIAESSISVSDSLGGNFLIERPISESSITVSETLARQLVPAVRTITEPTISVSDSFTRFFSSFRTLAEPSISISDAIIGAKFNERSISEPAISVSDSLVRVLAAFRILEEVAIVVDDSESDGHLFLNRTLTEPSITVSETLARVLFPAIRSIVEDTIAVSETLDSPALFQRSLSDEVQISVSEELFRQLAPAFRTLTEPSITVSDAMDAHRFIPKTITEPSIAVSETVAKRSFFSRIISDTIGVIDSLNINNIPNIFIVEPSISVSDTLTRKLSSFRTIAEPSISVSETVNGIIAVQILAATITDKGYTNPVRCRITFKSRLGDDEADEAGDQVIHYRYDSFVPEDRPFNILNLELRLVQGEIGAATLDIEDSKGRITDTTKISFNSIVEIEFKKELGRGWQRMMTGFVRRFRVLRPKTHALLYRVTVLSKQIVFNERVTNFKRAAKKTAIDSTIPLSTDKKMEANRLFKELINATDVLPLRRPTIRETGEFDTETGSISDEVTDFIAQIAPGLTSASEVANAITEASGAIWGCDEFGNPYLRYPTEKHSGIIITDNPQDTDSALNTSVNMDSFEYEDTIDTAEGFGNRLYVLNSKDTKSTASSSKASGNTTLTTRWLAQSFIADDNNITGAAFILSKIGDPVTTSGSIKGRLRANSGSANFPTGPTLASFEISLSQLSNSADVIFVNDIKPPKGSIIPGNRYWWVLQGNGLFDDTKTVRWHHDNDLSTPDRLSGRLPLVDADPTKPGNQFIWIRSTTGPVYAFSTFSSINHILTQSDPESIKKYGLIESVVNLPAFDDDATFQKALVKLLQTSAKLKRIYDYTRVTIPTAKFFLPGELVTVIDSKANLDLEKVINAEIVEVTYNFDVNTNAIGCKYVDIRMIGFIDHVLDNYLENKEC